MTPHVVVDDILPAALWEQHQPLALPNAWDLDHCRVLLVLRLCCQILSGVCRGRNFCPCGQHTWVLVRAMTTSWPSLLFLVILQHKLPTPHSQSLSGGSSFMDVGGFSPCGITLTGSELHLKSGLPCLPFGMGSWGTSFCSNIKVLPGGKACLFLSGSLAPEHFSSVQFLLGCSLMLFIRMLNYYQDW